MSFKKAIKIAAVRVYLNNLAQISMRKAGEAAIKLFALPQKGRLTADDSTFLNTSEKHIDHAAGFPVQTYKWHGGDKTVLLVHGWESNSARWKWLIEYLKAENYTIVALDAPAHGATGSDYFSAILYADMINAVLKRVQPYAVVGHSVGGFATALAVSQSNVKSIQKLILVAAPCNLRYIFDKFFQVLKLNKKVQIGYYKAFERIVGKSVDKVTVQHFIPKIESKGYLIYDTQDDLVPISEGFNIKKHWNGAEIYTTEGLGHSLQHEDIYKKIIEFLK